MGNAEGLEGCFNREGVCGKLFLGGLLVGSGGNAPVGGPARGREGTGRDISTSGNSWDARSIPDSDRELLQETFSFVGNFYEGGKPLVRAWALIDVFRCSYSLIRQTQTQSMLSSLLDVFS